MKTLLLGMGNPILSDDAIGVRLAADLKAALGPLARSPSRRSPGAPRPRPRPAQAWSELDIIEECAVGGLHLLELLPGYRQAVVLDAIQTGRDAPGAWHWFTAEVLRETVHLTNLHDANFATALALGRHLDLPLPADADIHIFAVEIQDGSTFSERLTPTLERAYPAVRTALFNALHGLLAGPTVSLSQN